MTDSKIIKKIVLELVELSDDDRHWFLRISTNGDFQGRFLFGKDKEVDKFIEVLKKL